MKYSDNIKSILLRRLKHEFECKVYSNQLYDLIDFMGNQYDLKKTFPYSIFSSPTLLGYLRNTNTNTNTNSNSNSGLVFYEWINTLTSNIESPYNKSRKLAREIKKLSERFSAVTPFSSLNYENLVISFCSFFVYSNKEKYFNEDKDYKIMDKTLNLLVDYLLCLLYIVNIKEQDEIEYILNEVVHSNSNNLIEVIATRIKKVNRK